MFFILKICVVDFHCLIITLMLFSMKILKHIFSEYNIYTINTTRSSSGYLYMYLELLSLCYENNAGRSIPKYTVHLKIVK